MVHFGETLGVHCLPNPPGEIGELFNIRELERLAVLLDKDRTSD